MRASLGWQTRGRNESEGGALAGCGGGPGSPEGGRIVDRSESRAAVGESVSVATRKMMSA